MNTPGIQHPLMNVPRWLFLIVLGGSLASCVSSRNTSSTSSDYNSYYDDLRTARPKFNPTVSVAETSTGRKPSNSTTNPSTRSDINSTAMVPPSTEPLHINRQLDAMLDTIAVRNQSIRYAQGYRIQVYVGNERQAADQAKKITYQNFPELNPYLSYRQPTYRLKVGDFTRRMDAERYLVLLRQQFSSATLLPDRIDIRKSLSVK